MERYAGMVTLGRTWSDPIPSPVSPDYPEPLIALALIKSRRQNEEMNRKIAYYGIAIWIMSLIKRKVPKEDVKVELIRITDEMYQVFASDLPI